MQEKKTILAVMGLELVASGGKAAILTIRPLILFSRRDITKRYKNIQKMYMKPSLLAGFVIFFLLNPIYSR